MGLDNGGKRARPQNRKVKTVHELWKFEIEMGKNTSNGLNVAKGNRKRYEGAALDGVRSSIRMAGLKNLIAAQVLPVLRAEFTAPTYV